MLTFSRHFWYRLGLAIAIIAGSLIFFAPSLNQSKEKVDSLAKEAAYENIRENIPVLNNERGIAGMVKAQANSGSGTEPKRRIVTLDNLQASRKRFGPLVVGGDQLATRSRITDAMSAAIDGNNEAALALAAISKNRMIRTAKALSPSRQESIALPEDFVDNTFYWLGLAADRGDLVAKSLYVNAAQNGDTYSDQVSAVNTNDSDSYRIQARKYLKDILNEGVADGFTLLSAAYIEGSLGLPYDLPRAYAALLILSEKMTSPYTSSMAKNLAVKLRQADLQAADAIVRAGTLVNF